MQPLQPQLQEIIDRIGQVNNILITVKANPSVDELSAALGLTIALNNFGKHATAVFSGQIPNAMSFLKPQKIFENNVHSLRDFIISLNKEKADKLRFAKDGEIVKIYITPYKSTITSQDLEYSEGDFNVQMVLAIGINSKEELDTVIAAHGRILHEATVATIMPGATPSQLGSINWLDPSLSSASAMVVQLLQSLNIPNGIAPEIATALLTGIVADTDRFSNSKTSPRIMELSAFLMNAGADHQLVTSSIGAVLGQTPKGTQNTLSTSPAPSQSTSLPPIKDSTSTEPAQDLVLNLHEKSTQNTAPNTTPSLQNSTATNTAPMVSSAVSPDLSLIAPSNPEVVAPAPIDTLASQNPTQTSEQTNLGSSSVLEKVLPKPQDATQTVLPADLLPPQSPITPPAQTVQPELNPVTPTAQIQNTEIVASSPTEASLPPVGSTPPEEVDKIRSEIDQIFSAEPFNPANQPRQDIGTEIILPEEEKPTTPESLTPELGGVTVDTSVQQDQAEENLLKPIPATKNDEVSANDVLGLSNPAGPILDPTASPANANQTNIPPIPGLESPPEVKLPPPPPAPAIETAPFGNTINFNPVQTNQQ
jgi:hypothetical protein